MGWIAVALALGVLGVLTRRILEEAIGAEDLNKVHLMETAIASNATLQGSFDQIERLAYRLLDWGDFRIYRVVDGVPLAGLPRQPRPAQPGRAAEGARPVPARGDRSGSRVVEVKDVRSDPRVGVAMADVGSLVIHPIRFGEELLGTLEVEHPKRHAYGSKDLAALSTLGAQIATAIHIAELRRPLLGTVSRSASRSRRSPGWPTPSAAPRSRWPMRRRACGRASGSSRVSSPAGSAPPTRSAPPRRVMADQGARAAEASGTAAEVAGAEPRRHRRGDQPAGRAQGVRRRRARTRWPRSAR